MSADLRVDRTKSGKPVRHGRATSYSAHGCRCDDCRTAASAYHKEMRHRSAALRERDRLQTQAHAVAQRKLREIHRDEFDRLYAAERKARGLPCDDPDAILTRLLAESTPSLSKMRRELRACGYDLPPESTACV